MRDRRSKLLAMVLSAALAAGCSHAPRLPHPPVELPPAVEADVDAPAFAPERVHVSVHLPPGYVAHSRARYPVLYVNDGQDMDAVGLRPTLQALYDARDIAPVIVVAIRMLPDRMGTYGLSERGHARSVVAQTKYGPVGARAHEYSQWLAGTLVPWVDARYRTRREPQSRAVLGWSLGALNAFNLGWEYPDVFGTVGAFSPSFWLSADREDAAAVQRTRLAQRMVDAGPARRGLHFYFAVGGREEDDDRDGDGINDAVDDTHDLVLGWREGDAALKGLAQLGYRVDAGDAAPTTHADIVLRVLPEGQHNQASWRAMLPGFLRWAYGPRGEMP